MDKESRLIGVLYSGDSSHVQKHTWAQNKGMEKDLPGKWKVKQTNKKTGVSILVSDKTDFKPTKIKKDKEGHYIMVKGSMQQEELTILNTYAPSKGTPRLRKQVLRDLQRDLGSHTTIMRHFKPHCQNQY